MPALNFEEIAPAHTGENRDQFELFARDFLEAEGFTIVDQPDRGPDAGRDLIVKEVRDGPGGQTEIRWLVSCKHKAHSGNSVLHSEDTNFRDRMETHACSGFIAFYSTLPGSSLSVHLKALQPSYGLLTFDKESIERKLLDSPKGRALAARYMPLSFQRWVVSSQYAIVPVTPSPIHDRFFLRQPHSDLESALAEATARNALVLIVVYDEDHSQRSRLNYCLGYFMEWETTKRLVDEHFVCILGPSSSPALGALVPEDDPLEECRLIVMTSNQKVIRSESVYANPKMGRERILASIKKASQVS